MSERKGVPPSEDRRKYSEPWRYNNRYNSTSSTNSTQTNNNDFTNGSSNDNNSNNIIPSSSSRRFSEQRPYSKSRPPSSSGSYNSTYSRYPHDSKYNSNYGYNKRYNGNNGGAYRSTSSSALNQKPALSSTTASSSTAIPTASSTKPPFQRYRSVQDSNEASSAFSRKRSGDLINTGSRGPSYSSSNYDQPPYRNSRFHGNGYNSNYNNGYDNRYRGNNYQRKTTQEHIKRDTDDDDLIYGSIKPKSEKSRQNSTESPQVEETSRHVSLSSEVSSQDKKEPSIEVISTDKDEATKDEVKQEKDVNQDEVKAEEISVIPSTEEQDTSKEAIEPTPEVEEKEEPAEMEREESSDSYDPAETAVTPEPEIVKPVAVVEVLPEKIISSIKDDIEELDVDDELEKQDELKENYLPKAIEGDIFPMNRLETKLWDLKANSKLKVRNQLPYLIEKSIPPHRYPFYESNILIHEQAVKPKLLNKLSIIKKNVMKKGKRLCLEFHQRETIWKERVKIMEDQLKQLHPNQYIDDVKPAVTETPAEDNLQQQQDATSTSSRRNRNTGIVNSEAEFAEILQRMKEEEESDPLFKAKQAAAVIPEMILDPIEKHAFQFISTNNLVTDYSSWVSRLQTDKIDNFSKAEHELFCEAYASYPKRFGKISAVMENRRSPEECVLHYYRTKRTTNYKQLVAAKNKRAGRKSTAKGKGKQSSTKSRNGTQTSNTPTVATPASGTAEDNYFPLTALLPDVGGAKKTESEFSSDKLDTGDADTEEESEVLYTETGRRKRAAAPTFDHAENVAEENNKKRSVSSSNLDAIDKKLQEPLKVKKQRVTKKKTEEEQQQIPVEAAPVREPVREPVQEPVQEIIQEPHIQEPVPQTLVNTAVGQEFSHEDIDQKLSKKDKKPPHITSYWSINDANKFPAILAEYGTQWQAIAKKIQTKTTTMVRNYYSKNANEVNNWVAIAREADARRTGSSSDHVEVTEMPIAYQYPPQQDMYAYQQQQQQQQQQRQPMKLPSLKDITHGMSDIYKQPRESQQQHYHTPSPPTASAVHYGHIPQHGVFKVEEERKYANVLNPDPEPFHQRPVPVPVQVPMHAQQQQLPPPTLQQPSRTSIMSLLNNEEPVPVAKSRGFNDLLNPVPAPAPAPAPVPKQQQQQQAAHGGLFSLAALAEVASEGFDNYKKHEDKL